MSNLVNVDGTDFSLEREGDMLKISRVETSGDLTHLGSMFVGTIEVVEPEFTRPEVIDEPEQLTIDGT